ncbi:hypothetical protein D9619_007831 [Psilocybe cf. subviscida]|uniref:RING-type domain-containing protein n=1 Tax=Psilocybe cf. subviscida TaxID=2480587 RepID=A0A8H5ATJ8_9AGAR|nr:hypothetical protein D9619_007831 [Psilocybe cf. subviscida]
MSGMASTWYSTHPSWNRNRAQRNPPASTGAMATSTAEKKSTEPLFGPSIGSVSSGPAWTFSSEKKVVTDELTPDVVSTWIEKSKEPSQPTTTLQALVNLKRPTLRLSPLTTTADDTPDLHHHGLEFEYDCDAPKCGIYVHVYLPKTHPDAPSTSSHHPLSKLLVFETVVEGGFGNRLTLEEGALLELGRFSDPNGQNETPPASTTGSGLVPVAESSSSGDLAASVTTPTVDGTGSNLSAQLARTTISNSNVNNAAGPTATQRRRFTHFHFRKRTANHSISGPALAVVDAEPAVVNAENNKKATDDAEEGVRVTIRLAALDEQGTELASPNEQITYLHIVRFGQKAALVEPLEGEDAEAAPATTEDTRPWVVKVVKREATIGPHTFHLHEIFGLTSTSSHAAAPTAPPPTVTHTYPPDENTAALAVQPQHEDEDGVSEECLLCLSSPREVVLLPCRHLVACKECALNMVEFGAGGTITQAPEPVGGTGADEVPATPGAGASTTAGDTPAAPANPRRKRKAKGWFCPVCRQPYTSMLRLTTSIPQTKESEGATGDAVAVPQAAHTHGAEVPPVTTETRSGGFLGRPTFLRGLTGRGGAQAPADVENQNNAVAARG